MGFYPSGDEITEDFAVNVGEAKVPAPVMVRETGMVQPHEVQYRGMQVVDVNTILRHFNPMFVAFPIDKAGLDPSSRQHAGEDVLEVISPLMVRFAFVWSATELSCYYHERIIQHATLF